MRNRNNESDTTRRERAGSLAEPHRGTVLDSGADIAHDRHDEGAERRQELDLPPPLDARGNLAERVRATFTADAEDAAAADAEGADAEGGRMPKGQRRKPVDVPPVWTGRSQRPS